MSSDRRRSPRVAIVGRLHGVAVSVDAPVKVNDISLGGMAIETPIELPEGAIQEFQLTLGDGSVVVLKGRIVRCTRAEADGEAPSYKVGVAFVDDDDPAESGEVENLIERLK